MGKTEKVHIVMTPLRAVNRLIRLGNESSNWPRYVSHLPDVNTIWREIPDSD
jgi:hypothetical protein